MKPWVNKKAICLFVFCILLLFSMFLAGCGSPVQSLSQSLNSENVEQGNIVSSGNLPEAASALSETADVLNSVASETEAGSSLSRQYAGKTIGVVTGSVYDQFVAKYLPDSNVEYYNTVADMALALDNGKISGYTLDEPSSIELFREYPNQCSAGMLEESAYAFIFPKDNEKSDHIREQMNEFIANSHANGTMTLLENIWFGTDETIKTVDYAGLTGENGTLIFAISTDVGVPFAYVKDNDYVGYDVDMAVRFCKEYGYGIRVVNSNPAGMLASVAAGKSDFGASTIAITEERKQVMNFSEPNYYGGVLLVALSDGTGMISENATNPDTELAQQFAGKRIGVLTGSIFDQIAEEIIPDCQLVPFNTSADYAIALETGKIDAYITDEPIARLLMNEYPTHEIYSYVEACEYSFIFQKNDAEENPVLIQLNEFLQKLRSDGTLNELKKIWLESEDSRTFVNTEDLTGENGTIRYASSTSIGVPFCYLKDGQYAGYEIDIVVRFCREYGYAFELLDSDFNGILANVTSGKCDFGGGSIMKTEEREKIMTFSDSNYDDGGVVIVVKSDTAPESQSEDDFFSSIRDSFTKTFLREERWKLFVKGINVTLLITAVSTLCGTVIAFFVFLVYRKRITIVTVIVDVLSDVLEKTPVVVILMILYYILFGKSTLDGVWVSCAGFSLIFAIAVLGVLKVAVGAVDGGQMEAALALGYTDTGAFLRVILPQSMEFFMPGYRSEIVSLIKATAVVGYIAVQDLTKVSDIVRGRTYEAFFPLIASAVIYFALAWLLTLFVRRIQFHINPKNRSKERVLKGVQTK